VGFVFSRALILLILILCVAILALIQMSARVLGFWECMYGLLIGLVSHIVIDVHDLKLLARKVKDWKRADL
jgi:ABC-type lipoprotein release transport system permease subunit